MVINHKGLCVCLFVCVPVCLPMSASLSFYPSVCLSISLTLYVYKIIFETFYISTTNIPEPITQVTKLMSTNAQTHEYVPDCPH